MTNSYPVHFLQEIANKIAKRNVSNITLATGKTPSGHIHVGILREIIICDALRRVFESRDKNVKSILFLDSFDAAKRFPDYIDEDFQKKHRGKPFALIPCPFNDCKCKSYAKHFGNELISTFDDFGIETDIIWTHGLYQEKRMQKKIKIALQNTEIIKKILRKYILPTLEEKRKEEFLRMQKDWMPAMVVCEKCNKIQTRLEDGSISPNRVKKFNKEKETVNYTCPACGHEGEISIFSGNIKLNWRIDWPAKWALFKTTCEPAGKDHCVKGGAYDSGLELCKQLYNYEGPIKVPYEWVRLGERDMKTSKGITFTPQNYLELADPELFRMLILRTNPMKHISFRIEEIPQYYDSLEKMEDIYYDLQEDKDKGEKELIEFLYPKIKIGNVPEDKPERLSIKLLVFFAQIQNILSFEKIYSKAKEIMEKKDFKTIISKEDLKSILERSENWVNYIKKMIAQEEDPHFKRKITKKIPLFEIPKKIDQKIVQQLSEHQKRGINMLREFLSDNEELDKEKIQNKIFTIAKEDLKIKPGKMFQAIYKMILGKKYGPRLGPFLEQLDKEWVIKRLSFDE
ncbi:MAG: lysine--tRNA ligase [Promethearchaeia archaeon]